MSLGSMIGVTIAAAIGVAGLVLPVDAGAGVAATSGRITLRTSPIQVVDTRVRPGGARLAANEPLTLPTDAVLVIMAFAATAEGSASVHRCGQPPSGDPDMQFEAGESVTRQLITDTGGPACFTSTTPIHVVVTNTGSASPTPVIDGLQYQSLAEPVDAIGHSSYLAAQWFLIPLAGIPGVPLSSAATVYRIEANAVGAFTAGIAGCDQPPSVSQFTASDHVESSVVYAPSNGFSPCLWILGQADVQLYALGWLESGGPDPTALPPEMHTTGTFLSPPGLRPTQPTRVLDTRTGVGGPRRPLAAGAAVRLDLAAYVTDSTTSVVMNVTAANPAAGGYVTVYPCDVDPPNASNLNFTAGRDVPNLVVVQLGINADVCFTSSAPTDLIADLAGTFELGAGLLGEPVTPSRILDTRLGIGAPATPVGGQQVLKLQVSGRGGVPMGAGAATLNVTVTGPTDAGYVTVYPCDAARPNASNLNFVAGQDIPNLVTVKLASDGSVCLFTTARTNLLADVAMWFGGQGTNGFFDGSPQRLLDTRFPPLMGITTPPSRVLANQRLSRSAKLATSMLPDVHAVTMNVTASGPIGDGYLTVFPCDSPLPTVSNLNFRTGSDVPNLVTVRTPADGQICFTPSADTHVIADVAGYFSTLRISTLQDVLVD